MSEIGELRRRVETVERRNRWLGAAVLLLALSVVTAAFQPGGSQEVVRARGLVVVDEDGNERVVMGAPMGHASDDPKLEQAVGLAVKDTAGRLHVVAGARNPAVGPDGTVHDRVHPGAGLTIYDPRTGQERGGFGVLEDGRANICLDYRTKLKEAACMSVGSEDGHAAFLLNGTPGEDVFDRAAMFVDSDGSGSIKARGGGANRNGVFIDVGEGRLPSMSVYDSTGRRVEVRNLAREP